MLLFQVLNSLENRKRSVLDFISKGEKLMQDPNCPQFLEGHVKKLKEAWEDTNEKAQARKKALTGKIIFIVPMNCLLLYISWN